MFGILEAVKRFGHERGFRLATYAVWWVRAAIQEYILRSWSLVKIGTTAAQKKLFFNLGRLKTQLQAVDERNLSPENAKKIATELAVAEADVVSMNDRLAGPHHPLQTRQSGWLGPVAHEAARSKGGVVSAAEAHAR